MSERDVRTVLDDDAEKVAEDLFFVAKFFAAFADTGVNYDGFRVG